MLCISVVPESRQLAKVDIYNASNQADLVEVCLDHLVNEPDFKDLLEGAKKPILFSCRRHYEGGNWQGDEDSREKLLRQAIVAGPDWIELEVDIANRVPRFGKTKRLISFTKMDGPIQNVDAVFERAVDCKADAVKFTAPTPTLDAAWPLLVAISKKRDLPVVGMALGRPGLTFSLLGRKFNSPWIYAALEKGMESHEGQATISELEQIYRWRDFNPQMRLVAVAGFGATEMMTVRVLNAGFAQLGLNIRCLPVELDKLDNFQQMFELLKINVVLPDKRLGGRIIQVTKQQEDAVKNAQFADLVMRPPNHEWQAYNSLWRGAIKALETALGKKSEEDRPLERRNILLVGANPLARTIAYAVQKRKGMVSVSALDEERAQLLAQMFEIRFVPFRNMYDTLSDVVIITEAEMEKGRLKQSFSTSYFRPGMTVMDLTDLPAETTLIKEARQRGCRIVEPTAIYADQLETQFKAITGQSIPPEAFVIGLSED